VNIAVKQLIVLVSDMDRSVAFYGDTLQLAPITVSEKPSCLSLRSLRLCGKLLQRL